MKIQWAKNSDFIIDDNNKLIIKNKESFDRWKNASK
ncbi:unnamed protein product, partial [marine sediment metagenome]